jgi:predicted transcriptional regulator of viral defense system
MKQNDNKPVDILFEIASQQLGYFTAGQSIQAGYQDAVHPYHIKKGNWIRKWRGIYRLARYPLSDNEQYALWSLWSRNRQNIPEGVYSHQTALSILELSDVMPQKLHMIVPFTFRRHSKIPEILTLHRKKLLPDEIEIHEGFSITRPIRTLIDLITDQSVSLDIIKQAYNEAKQRGLLLDVELKNYFQNKEVYTRVVNCIGEIKV